MNFNCVTKEVYKEDNTSEGTVGGSWQEESYIPILMNVLSPSKTKANNSWIVPRKTMLLLFHISLSTDIFWYCMLLLNLLRIIIYVLSGYYYYKLSWSQKLLTSFFFFCIMSESLCLLRDTSLNYFWVWQITSLNYKKVLD